MIVARASPSSFFVGKTPRYGREGRRYQRREGVDIPTS